MTPGSKPQIIQLLERREPEIAVGDTMEEEQNMEAQESPHSEEETVLTDKTRWTLKVSMSASATATTR